MNALTVKHRWFFTERAKQVQGRQDTSLYKQGSDNGVAPEEVDRTMATNYSNELAAKAHEVSQHLEGLSDQDVAKVMPHVAREMAASLPQLQQPNAAQLALSGVVGALTPEHGFDSFAAPYQYGLQKQAQDYQIQQQNAETSYKNRKLNAEMEDEENRRAETKRYHDILAGGREDATWRQASDDLQNAKDPEAVQVAFQTLMDLDPQRAETYRPLAEKRIGELKTDRENTRKKAEEQLAGLKQAREQSAKLFPFKVTTAEQNAEQEKYATELAKWNVKMLPAQERILNARAEFGEMRNEWYPWEKITEYNRQTFNSAIALAQLQNSINNYQQNRDEFSYFIARSQFDQAFRALDSERISINQEIDNNAKSIDQLNKLIETATPEQKPVLDQRAGQLIRANATLQGRLKEITDQIAALQPPEFKPSQTAPVVAPQGLRPLQVPAPPTAPLNQQAVPSSWDPTKPPPQMTPYVKPTPPKGAKAKSAVGTTRVQPSARAGATPTKPKAKTPPKKSPFTPIG